MKFVYTSCEPPKRFLTHHGIKGQQWGVRNGPPYPINPQDRSNSEKKAHGQKTSSTNADKRRFDKKKAAKIGAAAVGSALLIAGGIYLAKSGKLDNLVKLGHNNVGDILGFDPTNKPQVTESNIASFAQHINPSSSTTNCGSCAAAILDNINGGNSQALSEVPLHMRGVLESGIQSSGYDPEKLIDCFTLNGEKAKWSNTIKDNNGSRRKVTSQLEKELLSQGEGSKGIFYCEKIRLKSSSHYFAYYILNGKVHVLEGQNKYLQSTGADYTNLYDDIGQLFDVSEGEHGVRYAQISGILPERRDDVLKPRG